MLFIYYLQQCFISFHVFLLLGQEHRIELARLKTDSAFASTQYLVTGVRLEFKLIPPSKKTWFPMFPTMLFFRLSCKIPIKTFQILWLELKGGFTGYRTFRLYILVFPEIILLAWLINYFFFLLNSIRDSICYTALTKKTSNISIQFNSVYLYYTNS